MRIIKLNAIDSTNTFLRQLSSAERLQDNTVVVAALQTQGRGQMGTSWQSEPSKNLMASVFRDVSFLSIEQNFYLSMAMSLTLVRTLKDFQIKNVKVKWPNDILADQRKISGILIENVIKNNQLQATIIGFGLNVNQIDFEQLPSATSMQLVSGRSYDLEEVLQVVMTHFDHYMEFLAKGHFDAIKADYEAVLFRINKPSTFQDAEGTLFTGYIKGITTAGRIKLLLEDAVVKTFGLKDIKLLY